MAAFLSCLSPLLPGTTRLKPARDDEKAVYGEKAGLVRPSARGARAGWPRLSKVDTTERLSKLREVLGKEGLGA